MTALVKVESNVEIKTFETRTYTKDLDILDYFREGYLEGDFHSEKSLKETFEEFITYTSKDIIPHLGSNEEIEEVISVQILNWDEIYPILSYLIVVPEVPERNQCCKNYEKMKFYYCPLCGTKY